MHETEYTILKFMKEHLDKEFSTSELIEIIFSDEISILNEKLRRDFKDKKNIRLLKEEKSKLHRNILYHLNKLIADELIVVTRQGSKGRKFFRINLEHGEEIILGKKRRRIVISRPTIPAMPIEGFEQKGVIFKYDPNTWINRLNAVVLRAHRIKSIDILMKTINNIFSDYNDALSLNDFEKVIESSNINDLKKFIEEMLLSCEDFGRHITLTIDVKNIRNENSVAEFFNMLAGYEGESIVAIFEATIKEFNKRIDFFERIIKIYSDKGKLLYIKNKSMHRPPYIIGRAGPYTITEKDWDYYRTKEHETLCFSVASTCIAVDVKRFFESKSNIQEFRKLIRNILKTLFLANSAQRTRSEEYFRNIIGINGPDSKDIFKANRNYIRFWNYGWKQEDMDQDIMLELIKSAKKEVDEFCLTETSIFKACGMPTQFKIAFSCAYSDFSEGMTKQDFKRLKISGINDLNKKECMKKLREKEQIAKIFDGGDRMRIIRYGDTTPDKIIRELGLLLSAYKLPFLCYDFSENKKGNLKLTSFISKD